MSDEKRRPRSNYLINPPFQWAMIRWAILISLVNSFISILAFAAFFRRLVIAGVQQSIPYNSPYFQALTQEKSRLILIFGLTTFLSVCMITGFGIFISHKIAGPIYRLSRYLKNTDPKKDLPDLHFRKDDFFKDLADDFNFFKSRIGKE
jgi:hypothetical protein